MFTKIILTGPKKNKKIWFAQNNILVVLIK